MNVLFDTDRVLKRPCRHGPALAFWWQHLSDVLADRLALIKRRFDKVLVVAPDVVMVCARLQQARADWHCVPCVPHWPLVLSENYDAIILLGVPSVVDDVPRLLQHCHAALKPDGLLLAAFYGGGTLAELRTVLLQAEAQVTGHAATRVAPMISPASAASLLQNAGFDLPVVDDEVSSLTYATLAALMADIRAAGAHAVLHDVYALPRAVWAAAQVLYAAEHCDARGRLRCTLHGIFMSGWKG